MRETPKVETEPKVEEIVASKDGKIKEKDLDQAIPSKHENIYTEETYL